MGCAELQYGHAGAASSFIWFFVAKTDDIIALQNARGGVLGGFFAMTENVQTCLIELKPRISGIARINIARRALGHLRGIWSSFLVREFFKFVSDDLILLGETLLFGIFVHFFK